MNVAEAQVDGAAAQQHAEELYAFCIDRLGDPDSAVEAVAEAFNGPGKQSRLELFVAARREVARRNVTSGPARATDSAGALVEGVVNELRPRQREVLQLKVVHAFDGPELARILQVASDTAESMAGAAIRRFSSALAAALGTGSADPALAADLAAERYPAVLARIPRPIPPDDLLTRVPVPATSGLSTKKIDIDPPRTTDAPEATTGPLPDLTGSFQLPPDLPGTAGASDHSTQDPGTAGAFGAPAQDPGTAGAYGASAPEPGTADAFGTTAQEPGTGDTFGTTAQDFGTGDAFGTTARDFGTADASGATAPGFDATFNPASTQAPDPATAPSSDFVPPVENGSAPIAHPPSSLPAAATPFVNAAPPYEPSTPSASPYERSSSPYERSVPPSATGSTTDETGEQPAVTEPPTSEDAPPRLSTDVLVAHSAPAEATDVTGEFAAVSMGIDLPDEWTGPLGREAETAQVETAEAETVEAEIGLSDLADAETAQADVADLSDGDERPTPRRHREIKWKPTGARGRYDWIWEGIGLLLLATLALLAMIYVPGWL